MGHTLMLIVGTQGGARWPRQRWGGGAAPGAEPGALVRQAKRGASGRVQVPAEDGLTNHSSRVLPR